jgi:hypothetical protein
MGGGGGGMCPWLCLRRGSIKPFWEVLTQLRGLWDIILSFFWYGNAIMHLWVYWIERLGSLSHFSIVSYDYLWLSVILSFLLGNLDGCSYAMGLVWYCVSENFWWYTFLKYYQNQAVVGFVSRFPFFLWAPMPWEKTKHQYYGTYCIVFFSKLIENES